MHNHKFSNVHFQGIEMSAKAYHQILFKVILETKISHLKISNHDVIQLTWT